VLTDDEDPPVRDALRLEADDAAVISLTWRAVDESPHAKRALDVRCASCGAPVAAAARTPIGVLFVSWWDVDVAPDFQIESADRKSRRARRDLEMALPRVERPDAAELHPTTQHGVTALLTLPPELPDDYPDLLVRCEEHGDGVLDRDQVVSQVPRRGHRRWKVPLRLPHLAYDDPRTFPHPTRWS
jgi:hypothetical protein